MDTKISRINKVKMAIGGIVIFVVGYKLGTGITSLKLGLGLEQLMFDNPGLKETLATAIEKSKSVSLKD